MRRDGRTDRSGGRSESRPPVVHGRSVDASGAADAHGGPSAPPPDPGYDGSTADSREAERTGTERLTADEVFGLLRTERRRAVLRHLRADPETTTGDLADHVAAEEVGTTPDRLRSEDRKRVYISLYQAHLPKLADKGVIAYDSDRGKVVRLPVADQLDRRLDRLDALATGSAARRRPFAGIVAGLTVVAGASGIPPLDAVDPAWWAVVGLLALCALSVARRGR